MKDINAEYYKRIRGRSVIHFLIGLMPRIKQWVILWLVRQKAMRKGAVIGKDTVILKSLASRANHNLHIGDHSSIGSYKLDLRSPITIGSHVIISNDSEIITTSHYVDSPEWEHKYYGIEIEDYVWVASNVLILPSCRRIGYGAVIGAGAVVVRDVPAMSVMGGNPAQCLRKRKCVHAKLVISSLLGKDLITYWRTWINRKK